MFFIFWDTRNGLASNGWWFCSRGSRTDFWPRHKYWAYKPVCTDCPPASGWRVIPSWSEESSLAVILGTTTQRNVLIESTADDTGDLIQLPAVDLEVVIIGAKLALRYRNSMSRGLSMDETLADCLLGEFRFQFWTPHITVHQFFGKGLCA